MKVCYVCHDELLNIHPEWQNIDLHKKESGSNRVSPNHSISAADVVIKGKNRSNSCTELSKINWAEIHNTSLPSDAFDSLSRVNQYRASSRMIRKNIPAVLVEVPANDANCTHSGYMFHLVLGKSWKRFWFVIKDYVLYKYAASEDVAALESLPLPGFKVATAKNNIKHYPANLIIELSHPGRSKMCYFTENSEAHAKWLKAFRDCAELH